MKELLQKIILKVYEINEETKHTVFLDFSGHVNKLEIRIYEKGWKVEEDATLKKEAYIDESDSKEQLKEILKELEKIERN